jgi:hypothetical protein
MFRNLVILVFLSTLIGGCSQPKNSDMPENAIDPAVVDNPVSASAKKNSKNSVPVFKFETESHDFGKIIQGEKVSFAFQFKNVGEGDLVIRAAQGSCGCTVPEFPKDAIKPGDRGTINVTFNSEGREGLQEKTITIISNTMPNTHMLTITGNVEK